MNPPVIDRREQKDLAAELRTMISTYAPEWPTAADVENDPAAEAFVQAFARLLKILIERINRTPDKNFLSFLSMLGFDLLPPRAAQVPLQFRPAQSASQGGLIPAGTQVAVEGRSEIVFETREDMTIALPSIVRAVSYEPAGDRFTDHDAIFENTGTASLFEGSTQVPHRIYFGSDDLFDFDEPATVEFDLTFKVPLQYDADDWIVRWYQYDEEGKAREIYPVEPAGKVASLLEDGTVAFDLVQKIEPVALSGFVLKSAAEREWQTFSGSKRWIYAELDSALPVETFARAINVAPDYMIAAENEVVITGPSFLPFPQDPPATGDIFQIGNSDVLSRTGSTIVIRVSLYEEAPAPFTDVEYTFTYYDGISYQLLGKSNQDGTIETPEGTLNGFVDTTRAFSESGEIRFFCPEIVERAEATIESRWIRVTIASGGWGAGTALQPPFLREITMEYSSVPQIATANARVRIDSDSPVKADAAFLNNLEVDLTRDFYPFGDRPQFNNTFYFASEEVFVKDTGAVTITVDLSPGLPVPTTTSVTLRWEYFDGTDWQLLGVTTKQSGVTDPGNFSFTDTTAAFTQSGEVAFTIPRAQKTTLRAQNRTWLRTRIVQGNYGTDDPGYVPPSIENFTMQYQFLAQDTPEQVVLENNFFFEDATSTITDNVGLTNITRFVEPFKAPGEVDSSVYIGFDRSIASESLSMLFPLISRPFNAFLGTFNPNPPEIAWEYWSGSQWSVVSVNDGSDNLSRKEIVQILTPGNALARPTFGDDRFWLRLRLLRGSFSLKPEIDTIYTNVVWSDNQVTLTEELLGSSNGQPEQIFTLTRSPVLEGQQLVVLEDALTEEDRESVIADEGDGALSEVVDEAGDVVETRVRWHQVNHFEFSGPRSRHYIIDHGTGQITFGDGTRGYIPPARTNNIIMEQYRVGGGSDGNVTTGISEQRVTFPFVEGVSNPVAAEGGVNREDLEQIRTRGPATIKHRNRAVTFEDYESLVRESSGQIARVRTLQSTDSNFAFRPGYVTLIIVPDNSDDKPFPTPELVETVENYIEERASGFLLDALSPKINVVGPGYIQVSVEADVAYKNISEARQVEQRIRTALAGFLNPLTGGPDGTGWTFGRNVFISEIYEVIENVEGVDYVAGAVMRSSEQIYDLTASTEFAPTVPFPVGSTVLIRGQRTTDEGIKGVSMTSRLVEKLREDVNVTKFSGVGLKEGDFVTLTTPTDEFPLKLLIGSVNGPLLEIDPAFASAAYPPGSKLTVDGGVVQTTLVEGVPAETEITGLVTAIPQAGDTFEITSPETTINQQSGSLNAVSDAVSVIDLADNYLVYSGAHLIRAAQTG